MIRKYLRKKIDKFKEKREGQITESALEMHTQNISGLMEKVPSEIQSQLRDALVGKHPVFYAKIALIKRYEGHPLVLLKDTFYGLLDKIF